MLKPHPKPVSLREMPGHVYCFGNSIGSWQKTTGHVPSLKRELRFLDSKNSAPSASPHCFTCNGAASGQNGFPTASQGASGHMHTHTHTLVYTHRCPRTCMYAYTHKQLLGIELIIFQSQGSSLSPLRAESGLKGGCGGLFSRWLG